MIGRFQPLSLSYNHGVYPFDGTNIITHLKLNHPQNCGYVSFFSREANFFFSIARENKLMCAFTLMMSPFVPPRPA